MNNDELKEMFSSVMDETQELFKESRWLVDIFRGNQIDSLISWGYIEEEDVQHINRLHELLVKYGY